MQDVRKPGEVGPTEMPTISFPTLWHVGSLDAAAKGRGSLEGACLSVSRHPGAWRMIGRGVVGGPCWSIDASRITMLDALALDADARSSILTWGVACGLAAERMMWRVFRWDDELEDTMSMTLADRQNALAELDLHADESDSGDGSIEGLEEMREHVSTPLLDERTLQDRETLGDHNLVDLLLPLWVEATTGLQGVWWDERLDPMIHSAPRGGLIPSRIDPTAFVPTTIEPCDESDHDDGDDA